MLTKLQPLLAGVCAAALLAVAPSAHAQAPDPADIPPAVPDDVPDTPPNPDAPKPGDGDGDDDEPVDPDLQEPPINDRIAAALVARGNVLSDGGDHANAKKMYIEALERSPKGASAPAALTGLRAANEKLGIADLDDGRPSAEKVDGPVDPYADNKDDKPVDPYADNKDKPVDPYGNTGGPVDTGDPDEPNTQTSRGLMAWGAGYGFVLGMAIGGPNDDNDDVRGGAVLLGLAGIGAGVAGGYFASRRYPLSRGQVSAIASGGNWGMWNLAFLSDALTGEGTTANQVYKFAAAGGLLGAGGGAVYAIKAKPSEGDVAMINSLGAYGTTAGLLLGVAMDPPRAEAYSLNAFFGSAAGLGAGFLLAPRFEMSRGRTFRIDLGAAAGVASTWVLLYPLISDETTDNDEQFAGFFSTLTMAGGIGLAYYLTRNYDKKKKTKLLDEKYPAAVGLIRRSGEGRWSLGSPMLRPIQDPRLAPPSGFSLGVDLAGGRF